MEAQAMPWSGCTLLGPWFSGSSVLAGQLSSAPKASSLGQRLGAVGRGSCGQGLTGLLFASFLLLLPPPARAQCLVWKGPPRIGQVSARWLLTSPVPRLGSRDLVTGVLRAMCSSADPFDQGVVATEEVKEEPPEPFQKIGPSMRASPWGKGWVGGLVGAV